MSMIRITQQGSPRIEGWHDSSTVAAITWTAVDGGTHQQEVADEAEAIRLLESIESDDKLSLISAQLRRAGTGPAGS